MLYNFIHNPKSELHPIFNYQEQFVVFCRVPKSCHVKIVMLRSSVYIYITFAKKNGCVFSDEIPRLHSENYIPYKDV